MGLAKTAMMEAEERGWDAPDTWICANCVADSFLKEVIAENLAERECSYCGRTAAAAIAAPAEAVMEVIAATVHYYYAAPEDAGVPWEDGEWAIPTMDIIEVLGELDFDAHSAFFSDVLDGFHSSFWVEGADGYWAATRTNDRLPLAWKAFVGTVKHRTRFHFLAQAEGAADDQDLLTPNDVLRSIAELLRNFDYLQEIAAYSGQNQSVISVQNQPSILVRCRPVIPIWIRPLTPVG